ncbi:CheB methylesterase domain-containing protein [Chitinimonas lacunae]|uniref:protein-glutamate methylesterase n=1 Tax=Chitinimonas lacunae TaxID=1963018 RepID=A0ABV8MM21_9NEIS
MSQRQDPSLTASPRLIAIGASTGGPPVLRTILAQMPPTLRAPVVIVQHMAPRLDRSFVNWLGQATGFPVEAATQGTPLRPGRAYLAPAGQQLGIGEYGVLNLEVAPAEHGACPSVDYLFRSVAHRYGRHAIGVLLTGMGEDGAGELLTMRRAGAVTVAQDEASATVFGMPGAAIRLDAAQYILPPQAIADLLRRLAG